MNLTFIEQLGSGGFGTVDRVRDDQGREYARKTFSINQPMDQSLVPNVRKRFVREAKLQSGIKHRNVVPILHTSLLGDNPWYLMPVAESTLSKDIAQQKTLNGEYKLAIADIIAALEDLHSMQIYHRDLKPQNVLRFLNDDRNKTYYAVSDFGFASVKDSKLSKLTYTGMAKGADYFSAPEIVKDLRNANAQSDIYSLGCILHEMVGIEDRVPCAEIKEAGPFAALLLSCTRLKPDRRFKDVTAVRDILLSIDVNLPPVLDEEAVTLSELLKSDQSLTKADVELVARFIEDNSSSDDARALMRSMSIERIREIVQTAPQSAKRIGIVFAEWVRESVFDFDYCDVLANRINAFFEIDDLELQADCLLALMKLGANHNRWYVERMFIEACGSLMEEPLAKRLAVEFRAGGQETCETIEHIERSISTNRGQFHPVLVKALDETCS